MFIWNVWKISERHDLAVQQISQWRFPIEQQRKTRTLGSKCVIHTTEVKQGTWYPHLMSNRELMLLLQTGITFFSGLFFDLLARGSWCCWGLLMGVGGWGGAQSCPVTLRWLWPLRMARTRAKICASEGFAFGFISSSPNLSIFDCLRGWGGARGELGNVWLEVWFQNVIYDKSKGWGIQI